MTLACLSWSECSYNAIKITIAPLVLPSCSAIRVWTLTKCHWSSDHKRQLPNHSLTSGHLKTSQFTQIHTHTHTRKHKHTFYVDMDMRHLGNRMETDLTESLIIIELPCAFLAPWLLFHGFLIFIPQIVKSTLQISMLPAQHRYPVGAKEFECFLSPQLAQAVHAAWFIWKIGFIDLLN